MKKIILLALVIFNTGLYAQVISFQKIATFSLGALDSMITSAGLLPGFVVPQYEVDYYKVTYLTPYIHPDSLVQASGAIAIPKNTPCPLPLVGYGHGTQTRKSKVASLMDGGQWDINTIFASTGYVIAMPDYLGLGDADPRVVIHPYIHSFSQANTTINMLRATRQITDSIGTALNGQIFLCGYSQGGGATVATVKEIQQNYPSEFNIAGSAPMSGAYDLINAQVDLIASNAVYPTPSYLPYIIFSYQSIYQNLFNTPSDFFKSPYDTVLPPLFYAGNTSINNLNNLCNPIPRNMIIDSVVDAFFSDSLHPLRLNLYDNDMIRDWFPLSPMKLIYCNGDDQVSYLNSENAFDAWTAGGSTLLQKQDLGNLNHNSCAPFAFLNTKNYFDSLRVVCNTNVTEASSFLAARLYPNPFTNELTIRFTLNETVLFSLYNFIGQQILQQTFVSSTIISTAEMADGIYFYELRNEKGTIKSGKVIKQ